MVVTRFVAAAEAAVPGLPWPAIVRLTVVVVPLLPAGTLTADVVLLTVVATPLGRPPAVVTLLTAVPPTERLASNALSAAAAAAAEDAPAVKTADLPVIPVAAADLPTTPPSLGPAAPVTRPFTARALRAMSSIDSFGPTDPTNVAGKMVPPLKPLTPKL